ncbi:MAG: NifB/NifX family molybdenum-iron cluster-binding protein [Geobacteraceae bacterium]|jgi:predicted Fe-Mo cluster-binding NifX family protein
MKIAIALGADGVSLAHFGHAERFDVYDDSNGLFLKTESRLNSPPCGREDSGALMSAAARLVSDCAAVVAARFGPCALREVGSSGVFPFEMAGVLDKRLLSGLTRLRDFLPGGRSKQGRNNTA